MRKIPRTRGPIHNTIISPPDVQENRPPSSPNWALSLHPKHTPSPHKTRKLAAWRVAVIRALTAAVMRCRSVRAVLGSCMMAEVNGVGKSKMAAACPQIENLTFNLRKRCKILRKSSPPHYLALAASLLQVTAIDEGGFGGVKAGNSCEKCQIMEKIRLYGLP